MRLCYECTDPSKKTAYTNTKDLDRLSSQTPVNKDYSRPPYSSEIREVLRDTVMTLGSSGRRTGARKGDDFQGCL